MTKHITAGKLRELLKDVPDDRLVVMSRDAEGNDYSQLARVDVDRYRYDGASYGGEVYDHTDPYYTRGHEHFEENIPDDAIPCVLLWPVN